MGKYLKMFKTHSEYEAFKASSEMAHPNVSICDDDFFIHYDKSSSKIAETPVLYKTDMGDMPEEVDFGEFFIYDGTYEVDGNTYYKWKKHSLDIHEEVALHYYQQCILTETKNFSSASLDNPKDVFGYIYKDMYDGELQEGYKSDDKIVLGTSVIPQYPDLSLERHNTTLLDANGHAFIDLGLPSGTKWAAANVGAEDSDAIGYYFAWGETSPKSNNFTRENYRFYTGSSIYSKYTTDGLTELEISDDAVNVAMGGDWRIPSYKHFVELWDNCIFTEQSDGSYLLTSKINGNAIMFPESGIRYEKNYYYYNNPELWTRECFGYYDAYCHTSYLTSHDKYYGLNVRGVLY